MSKRRSITLFSIALADLPVLGRVLSLLILGHTRSRGMCESPSDIEYKG